MFTKKERWFTLLFSTLVCIELVVGSFENLEVLRFGTKPLILTILILYFISSSPGIKPKIKRLTLTGLFFSLVGDVALMFVPISETYFLLGLVGFLIAHIAYVFLFLEHRNKQRNLVAFSLIILAYAGSIFYVLEKDLNGLIIPVIIYIIAISAMVITAYARKGNANPKSYLFVLAGAILFLISDSFLAINKFSQELPFAHLSVMGTYSFAQFGITLGILKLKK